MLQPLLVLVVGFVDKAHDLVAHALACLHDLLILEAVAERPVHLFELVTEIVHAFAELGLKVISQVAAVNQVALDPLEELPHAPFGSGKVLGCFLEVAQLVMIIRQAFL